jgi:hypothetical protein
MRRGFLLDDTDENRKLNEEYQSKKKIVHELIQKGELDPNSDLMTELNQLRRELIARKSKATTTPITSPPANDSLGIIVRDISHEQYNVYTCSLLHRCRCVYVLCAQL